MVDVIVVVLLLSCFLRALTAADCLALSVRGAAKNEELSIRSSISSSADHALLIPRTDGLSRAEIRKWFRDLEISLSRPSGSRRNK